MTVQPWDTIIQKLPSAWLTGQGPRHRGTVLRPERHRL
jgi:hypothetical protein